MLFTKEEAPSEEVKVDPNLLKLDLACGQNKREGFFGVDEADIPGVDKVVDLEVFPWSFDDNSVGEAHCSHYVEHTPMYRPDGQDGLIAFMNELYRVCAPNAIVTIIHPYFKCERAFQDPTHRRFITPTTWQYFYKDWRVMQKLDHYPITANFEVVELAWTWYDTETPKRALEFQQQVTLHDWDRVSDLHITLKAIK